MDLPCHWLSEKVGGYRLSLLTSIERTRRVPYQHGVIIYESGGKTCFKLELESGVAGIASVCGRATFRGRGLRHRAMILFEICGK